MRLTDTLHGVLTYPQPDLELDDIKNSRFVSRTWNGIASRILFDTLYVPWSPRERPYSDDSCQTRVQQRVNSCIDLLCHVTSSPHFASLIQAVCIDPVQCSETQYGYTRVADTTTMREKKIELWSCAQRAFPKLTSLRRVEIPSCNCYFPHSDRLDLDMKPIIAALPPFATLVVPLVTLPR
ncbi:hypothetical protein BDZ89DRAFT_552012 [Hymenopellis radicata]|nr:hypothetical protein BDZ89DRAFT_552012 [Hymenopellis radicata]